MKQEESAGEALVDQQAIWTRVLARLRFSCGEATFNSWFKHLTLHELSGGEIILHAPTRFVKEWLLSHYHDEILQHVSRECDGVLRVDIRVKAPVAQDQTKPVAVTDQHAQSVAERLVEPKIKRTFDHEELNDENISAYLDPRLTFENFVVGSSNQLPHAAARTIAEAGGAVPGSNPLFLYGGVGLGKTHLMHAIAWHIRKTNPDHRVVYLSAEKFMYQFVRAIRNKDVVAFKEYFRSVDVLMIDDVQFICGKDSTQEEFFHTFNALVDSNRQLIISADRSPCDLDGMEERIRSRLGWGLVADINDTTYELRLGILQSKVELLRREDNMLDVPLEVLEFLASKITSNIRELEGALNKVVMHTRLMNQAVSLDMTRLILRDLLRANERVVSIEDIKQRVSEHCNVRMSDMNSSRRARNIARPRQIAMYLAKRLTTHSLPEIGRNFGGKDHTTVMHAVKRVEALCAEDKMVRDDVEILSRMLQS